MGTGVAGARMERALVGCVLLAVGGIAVAGAAARRAVEPRLSEPLLGAALGLAGLLLLISSLGRARRAHALAALGSGLALWTLSGIAGFHAHAVATPPAQPSCSCISLLPPLSHGWYLLGSGLLGLSCARQVRRHLEGSPAAVGLLLALAAGVGGWMYFSNRDAQPERGPSRSPVSQDRVIGSGSPVLAGTSPKQGGHPGPTKPVSAGQSAEIVVSLPEDMDAAAATSARIYLLRGDGTVIHVKSLAAAQPGGRLTYFEGDSTGSAGALRVSGLGSVETVAFDPLGAPIQSVGVEWQAPAGGTRRGRAELRAGPSNTNSLVLRVRDGLGVPVGGLELLVASTPAADLLGTAAARVHGGRLNQTSIRVMTDESGRCEARGLADGAAYVRVLTPGWCRLPATASGDLAASTVAAGTEDDRPVTRAPAAQGVVAPEVHIRVGVLLVVPICIVPPPMAEGRDRALRAEDWVDLAFDRLAPPPVEHRDVHWSAVGEMPFSLPEGVQVLTRAVALDARASPDPSLESGVGVVRYPGCDTVRVPLRWQRADRVDAPLARLLPRRPGEVGALRVTLRHPPTAPDGVHALLHARLSLDDLEELDDVRSRRPGTRRSCEFGVNAPSFSLAVLPGRYRVVFEPSRDRPEVEVPGGETVDVTLACDAASILVVDPGFEDLAPSDVAVTIAPARAAANWKIPGEAGPGLSGDLVFDLHCVAKSGATRPRLYWLRETGADVFAFVTAPGRRPWTNKATVTHGSVTRLGPPIGSSER